jgi:general L-amino acid transport system substrate-binding protein
MLKKLAVLFAVLALVVAACGDSGDGEETTTTTEATTDGGGDTGQETGDSTLATVQARGELICGVSGSAVGFSETQADGSATGFDAEYCQAVAAAVFGDSTAVQYRALTAAERFEALKSGEIDVLIRNTTFTQTRDVTLGIDFNPTTYYDGQQMMGDPARLDGLTPQSGFEAVDGATVCTNAGTTTEKNISEGAAVAGVEITLETVETFPEAMEKFKAGTCDIVTTDGSGLYGNRAAETQAGTPGADAWVIFPEAPISKEPLGPAVRQNDSQWKDIIDWVVYTTFIADEYGVTSENVDELRDSNPELTRLFGGEGELQTAMGLDAEAMYNVVSQVGSYGEIFARTLTVPLGIEREGTYNAQWYNGGLIYSPPAR